MKALLAAWLWGEHAYYKPTDNLKTFTVVWRIGRDEQLALNF